jgi:hypothetical protein
MTDATSTSVYRGTSEGAIAAFFEHANVAMTSSGKARVEHAFRDAMEQLVLLHHYQAVHGPLPAERLAEVRRQSAPLLAISPRLGAYIWRAQFLAEGANENYWYELSIRRSAIQLAIDDYPGPPVADQIKPEDVEGARRRAAPGRPVRRARPDRSRLPPARHASQPLVVALPRAVQVA